MKIQDLIDALEEQKRIYGEQTEVRFAQQPSWPLEYSIDETVVAFEPSEDDNRETGEPIVYLAEADQIGYLPGAVSEELGWR